jgi:hypothetical protein
MPTSPAFSHDSLSHEIPELDAFDRIALSFTAVARPASQDKFKNYNSLESYNLGKKGAFV